MWLRLMALAGLVSVLIAAAFSVGFLARRAGEQPSHMTVRSRAILSHAAQAQFDTVILGDSMVELAYLPSICGGSVLNAGVGGAKAADLAPLLQSILRAQLPKRVIIAVGVNDAVRRGPTPSSRFEQSLTSLSDIAHRAGVRVVFATIVPTRQDRPTGAAIDPQRIAMLNDALMRRNAIRMDRRFPSGLQPEQTADGVHLLRPGYGPWLDGIGEACTR